MKLTHARIRTFRSIVDSGDVDIENRLTVLVGKNEQGKTTFLKALASFNPTYVYSLNDLPNHLSTQLAEREAKDLPIVTLRFETDPSDIEVLKESIDKIEGISYFEITRYFDGHYDYKVRTAENLQALTFRPPDISTQRAYIDAQLAQVKEKFNFHSSRVPALAQQAELIDSHIRAFGSANFLDIGQLDNLYQTFVTGLASVPGQDPAVQQDIESPLKEIFAKLAELKTLLSHDRLLSFTELLPIFVTHSTRLDMVPNDVNLTQFLVDPNTVSRPMANLCLAAGLSMQKIREIASSKDSYLRQRSEEHYNGKISGGLNEYWTQVEYQILFRFESDRLLVFISDDNYVHSIPPGDRSDGFQWYLSFYSTIWNAVGTSRATVLLLDNPGIELHADGQRDIKRFLEEKLPMSSQIVYVTHSPAMIDPFNLAQVRQVARMAGDQGTKVSAFKAKDGESLDLLEPVRSAIGSSLVTSLMFNQFNILVEGAADKPLLEAGLAVFYKDEHQKYLVNGSISESKDAFLTKVYMRANLPFAIYLDGDAGGRRLKGELEAAGVPGSRIVSFENVFTEAKFQGGDFEVEDIFTTDFYHSAVETTYRGRVIPRPANGAGKITKKYEAIFRQNFDFAFQKRAVAETIKKVLIEGGGDFDSRENLKRLTEAIVDVLKGQVTPAVPAEAPTGD